jgi:transcriptional regulator with XRE-family HTH domain
MSTEGKRVKEIREKLQLNQEEFAKLFGVSRSFITQVESGNKFLKRKYLSYLLETYNININYLLAGIGEPFLTKEPISKDNELYKKFKEFMKQEGF